MTKRGRQAFEPLSNHLSEEAWVSHLKQMGNAGTPSKTPGTCGSFLEVLALALTYKKYVVVHQYRQPPLIFPSPQSTRKALCTCRSTAATGGAVSSSMPGPVGQSNRRKRRRVYKNQRMEMSQIDQTAYLELQCFLPSFLICPTFQTILT